MRFNLSIFLAYLLLLISYSCIGQQLYSIPKQTIDPYKILGTPSSDEFFWTPGDAPKSMTLDMDAFEISNLVTFGEYKEYLKTVKKDSSAKFYLSQMPDTSMCLPDTYKEYIGGNIYDSFPVMGIRCESALNYCRWKTMQSNKDSIKYIYRLPCKSEWLAAYSYLNTSTLKNDFSQNYSDWLLNTFDEGAFDPNNADNNIRWNHFDYIYLPGKKAPNVLKRKCIIGDSYLFKLQSLADYRHVYGYSYQGYRQIGFRVVKEIVNTKNLVNRFGSHQPSMDTELLRIWGLK